jgi:hypothetical protein
LRLSSRKAPLPLDDFLPDYDVNEIHSIRVAAAPDAVLAAVRALTVREVPLLVVLMSLRRLPAAIHRRRPAVDRSALDRRLLDQFTRGGFLVLEEGEDELVLGVVGRFWTMDGGVRRTARDEFVTFHEPGFAKAVVNFHVRPAGGGAELTTETRVRATDEDARRRFRRYWRLVMPGSAAIRRAWLRAVRKRSEAAAVGPAEADTLDR